MRTCKKTARITACILGGTLLVLCLVVAGALIWLRTDHGEKTVAELVTDALADQGIFLSTDSFSGPLPSRLLLKNVRLADAGGEWLAAKELELRLDFGDLLHWRATVSLLRADALQVFRLPVLPLAGQADPSPPPEPSDRTAFFDLPIGVRLEALTVNELGIFAPVLFPEAASAPLLVADIHGHAQAEAGQPLTAAVTLDTSVAAMPLLAAGLGREALPITDLALTAAVHATVGNAIESTVQGTVMVTEQERSLPIAYQLDAAFDGTAVTVRSVSLDGLDIRLDAHGKAVLAPLTADTQVTLLAGHGGEWAAIAARMSGQDIRGEIKANLTAALDAATAVQASLALSGQGMQWGMEQAQGLLGEELILKATVTGGGEKPYALRLETLEAGAVALSGTASFVPENTAIQATVSASLETLSPLAPGLSGSLSARAEVAGNLDAPTGSLVLTGRSIKAETTTIDTVHARAVFTGTPQAPAGTVTLSAGPITMDAAAIESLKATANLSGTLDAPQATLEALTGPIKAGETSLSGLKVSANLSGTLDAPVFSVSTASDAVRTAAGLFDTCRLTLEGEGVMQQNGERSVRGRTVASIAGSPAGPLALSADIAVGQTSAGAVTARLSGLDVTLAGTDMAADITAAIPAPTPGAAAPPLPSLQGSASAEVRDWQPIAALTGLPISGSKAGLHLDFSHEGAVQRLTGTIKAERLTLPDIFAVSDLAVELAARDFASPDMTLHLGMGKGGVQSLTWRTGAALVQAQKGVGTFTAALRTDMSAAKALDAVLKRASAAPATTERLTLAGRFSLSPVEVILDRLAARLPDSPLGVYLSAPATVSLSDTVRIADLRLNVVPGDGSVALDALLDTQDADVTASIANLPFRLLRDVSGAPLPDGSLSAEAVIKKKGASVQGTANAKATVIAPAAEKDTLPVIVTLASTLDAKPDAHFPNLRATGSLPRLKGTLTLGLGTGQLPAAVPAKRAGTIPDAQVHFNIPLHFGPNAIPEPAPDAPLGASIAWSGEIAPLWALLPLQDRNLSGLAQIDATLTGTLAKPDYSLKAYVANARYEDHILGLLLSDIALEASTASASGSKLLLRAEDGRGGYVAVEGQLSLPQLNAAGTALVPYIKARGQINHLQPLHRHDIALRLSGRLSADGPLNAMKVGADVEVERGEILIQHLTAGVRTLEITDADAPVQTTSAGPELDVKVTIPNRFYIRGRGLDSEWAGQLAVTGTAAAPSLTGSLNPVRGSFDLLSKSFIFSEGDITFMGGERIDPGLNLSLTYDGPNIVAVVRILGRAGKPEILMESIPPLPQDQIMADVLFGKEFSQLSRFEALQVANSIRQLANIGGDGLDPLSSMRTSLGIDMLQIGSSGDEGGDNRSVSGAPGASTVQGGAPSGGSDDASTTPTLEAGKYINDAIYVGVEQGATPDSTGVRVDVELRPNLNLQGKTTSRSSEIGLGWKKDY